MQKVKENLPKPDYYSCSLLVIQVVTQLHFMSAGSRTHQISVPATATVHELKMLAIRKLPKFFQDESFMVVQHNLVLEDDMPLDYYHIQNGAVLKLQHTKKNKP